MKNLQKLIAVFALLFLAGNVIGFVSRPTSLSSATSSLCASAPPREKSISYGTAEYRVTETNDKNGREICRTDENNHKTLTSYDPAGRPILTAIDTTGIHLRGMSRRLLKLGVVSG